MNFDIVTILVAVSLIAVVNAFTITVAWRGAKSMPTVIGYWSLSQVLLAAGVILVGLRSIVPAFASVIIANACIVASHVAIQEGIARYMGKTGQFRNASLGILAVQVVLFIFFTYVVPDVSARIIVYGVATASLCLFGIITLHSQGKTIGAPLRFLSATLMLYIGLMMFRIASALAQDNYADFLKAGSIQALGLLGSIVFCSSLSLCFFWLIAFRLQLERQQAEEAVRYSEIRYRAIMEQSFDGLALVDVETRQVMEVNRRFTEMTGYSLPEDSPLYVEQYVVDLEINLEKRFAELKQLRVWPSEMRQIRNKNGTIVSVERAGSLIDIAGKNYLLTSMRDMTAEQLRQVELLRDIEIARKVQQELLPKLPESPLVVVRTIYHPANVVSGDSYYLEWRNEGNLLRGFLVDVSGHGLGTALQNSSINVLLSDSAISQLPLKEQVQWINTRTAKYFTEGSYAAILGFELDLPARELRYVGAGITQFLVNGRKILTPGMFVGMWHDAGYEAGAIPVAAGDCLYFLTDGFTDALTRPENAEFWSPDGTDFDADFAALEKLVKSGRLRDDATGVCLKVRDWL